MPGIRTDPLGAFRKRRTEDNEVAKVMLSDECDRRTAASLSSLGKQSRFSGFGSAQCASRISNAVISVSKFLDLNQILGSPAYAKVVLTAQMRQQSMATSVTMNKGAFR